MTRNGRRQVARDARNRGRGQRVDVRCRGVGAERGTASQSAGSTGRDAGRLLGAAPGFVLALGLGVALSGCGSFAPGIGGPSPAPDPGGRPVDALLDSPELQRVVRLQIERDGEALVGLLDDEDPVVRARAAFGLASVQDPDAVEPLLAAIDDPDPRVRADAAFAAALSASPERSPSAETARALLAALEDETDPVVRATLLEAVARTGGEEELQALLEASPPEADTAHAGAPAFARSLARFGVRGIHSRDAVTWLVDGIRASSPVLRADAAYYFGRVPQPRFWQDRAPILREALASYAPDDPAAMHLLRALGIAADPVDRERVLSWIDGTPDWRIRVNAIQAAAAWRNEEPVRDALFEALGDSSTHVAVSAAQALATNVRLTEVQLDRVQAWVAENPDRWRVAAPLLQALGSAGRGDILFAWLENRSLDEALPQAAAIEAMAYVDDPRVGPALLRAAGAEDARVSSAALAALTRRWRIMRSDTSLHESYYEAFSSALRTGGVSEVIEVAQVLVDPVFQERGAVELLAERAVGLELPEQMEALTAVLGALGWARDHREIAEPAVREHLDSGYPSVARAAARALTALTGESVQVPEAEPARVPSVDWVRLAELGPRPRMILETGEGRVVVVLDATEAPLTVSALTGYAAQGLYDDTPFHRVIPNFVAQGGDFVRGDGTGSPETVLRTELTLIPFVTGVLGMASAGKDTEGSQFYITHSNQPHLEGGYTSFGRVVEGMDVVGRINEGERLLRATVEPGGS